MPTWELNRKNMGRFTSKLRNRINFVKNRSSVEAYNFLLNFGYHAKLDSGPDGKNGPGWSYYYAANWNINISTPMTSVLIPERRHNEFMAQYENDLSEKKDSVELSMMDHAFDEDIFVTNSVWYGGILNGGGDNSNLFVGSLNTNSNPNRFIEQCEEHVRIKVPSIIRNAKKEIS